MLIYVCHLPQEGLGPPMKKFVELCAIQGTIHENVYEVIIAFAQKLKWNSSKSVALTTHGVLPTLQAYES